PCPCGSGKKYKKCCGATSASADPNIRYDRIRRLDTESRDLLMRFAKQRYGEEAIEDAWDDFLFSDDIPFDDSHPEGDFFERWLTFNWAPENIETLAEVFLAESSSKLDAG